MKNTWTGINLLINRTKETSKPWFLKFYPLTVRNKYINDPTKLSDVLKIHKVLPSKIKNWNLKYHLPLVILRTIYPVITARESFFFNPLTALEIENEIVSIGINKAHGLYSCPTRILRSVKHIVSKPLAAIMNIYTKWHRFQTSRSQITEYMF